MRGINGNGLFVLRGGNGGRVGNARLPIVCAVLPDFAVMALDTAGHVVPAPGAELFVGGGGDVQSRRLRLRVIAIPVGIRLRGKQAVYFAIGAVPLAAFVGDDGLGVL